MLKQQEKTFVVAYEVPQAKKAAPAKKGGHLRKEDATREVLNRIVKRVKKI